MWETGPWGAVPPPVSASLQGSLHRLSYRLSPGPRALSGPGTATWFLTLSPPLPFFMTLTLSVAAAMPAPVLRPMAG